MSEPLDTFDRDKKAMSEAIKKDIEKDKENLARVEADKDEKGYEKDDDKKAEKLDKEIAKDKASGNDDKLYEEMKSSVLWKSYAIPLTTALISKKSCAWALRFQLRSNF